MQVGDHHLPGGGVFGSDRPFGCLAPLDLKAGHVGLDMPQEVIDGADRLRHSAMLAGLAILLFDNLGGVGRDGQCGGYLGY